MKHKICPACGAHIDHVERCECGDRHEQIEQELARHRKPARNVGICHESAACTDRTWRDFDDC